MVWTSQTMNTSPQKDFLKSFARANTDFVAVFQKNQYFTYGKTSAIHLRELQLDIGHLQNFVVFSALENVMELNHNLF